MNTSLLLSPAIGPTLSRRWARLLFGSIDHRSLALGKESSSFQDVHNALVGLYSDVVLVWTRRVNGSQKNFSLLAMLASLWCRSCHLGGSLIGHSTPKSMRGLAWFAKRILIQSLICVGVKCSRRLLFLVDVIHSLDHILCGSEIFSNSC